MEDLISSISSIIVDYADGEFGRLDEAHVRRWIEQFDEVDREVVLAETNRILKRTYITKEEFSKFISSLITSPKFSTENQADFWSNVSLCDVQLNGKSQTELVSLVREHVQNNYGFQPKVNSQSEHYIYLDDFLFSGNRLVLRNPLMI
ncbi:phosphoribosyltransferase-like protein [Vibrio vulnificus]|uniref:phosphoribosyltransferase-like protein n=1 Tax=Vibrio vulnificus TaxID=672 RepID=UPI0040581B63